MTKTKNALSFAAGLALFGVVACDNDKITEINNNPNSPQDAPAGAVFTQAAVNAAGRMVGNGFDLRQMEFLAQHLAEVQYPDEDRYARIRASDVQGTFITPYSSELADLKQVMKKGRAANQAGIWAPAEILSQWEFNYITAAWGDIPYSEALTGDSTGGVLLPKYDAQKDVYAGMLAKLTAASAALSGAQGSLGGADPIYAGSNAKWQKFANSLRLRLAIQISNVDQAKADAEIRAALAAPGGVFTSNADNAALAYPGDGVFDNPWANNFKSRDDHRLSKTLTDRLISTNDPRLPIFAEPTIDFQAGRSTVKYAGQPNGLSAAVAGTYFNTASRIGRFIYPAATPFGQWPGLGVKQPAWMMTFAEVSFIKAEAAARGIGGLNAGQARQFYEDGIRASIQQWAGASGIAVSTAEIDAYIAQPSIAYAGGTAGLRQIATQKWIALFLDGAQAWFEWRRTCTPDIRPGPAAIFSYVPRRLEYPVAEQSVNNDNLKAAIARQGPDVMDTRVYIDKPTTPAATCQ
jgi:hypothetical protein